MSRVELVVAHFKEDLGWLNDLVESCPLNSMFLATVYEKGGSSEIDADKSSQSLVQHKVLKNVGRETHTYLSHIIENYYKLADVTAFVQGKPSDHSMTIKTDLEDLVTGRYEVNSFKYLSDWRIEIKNFVPQYHPRIQRMLGDLYDDLFRTVRPQRFCFNAGAMFCVTRQTIQQRPKWFYEYLIGFVDKAINPIHGFCFERLWELIFDKE
ncbi:unnamed protein product, partial [Phaeothamnion confervicola]